jgi:hypothetical protein
MIQGSWARGLFGTLLVGALTLTATEAYSGFEIGNGTFTDRFLSGNGSLADSLEGSSVDESGRVLEILAPPSDGGWPRTRLQVHSYSIANVAEEALDTFLTFNKGWVGFSVGAFYGVHREREVRKDWNRLEMQLLSKNEKFVICLVGNKAKSAAYMKLANSLLSEVAK